MLEIALASAQRNDLTRWSERRVLADSASPSSIASWADLVGPLRDHGAGRAVLAGPWGTVVGGAAPARVRVQRALADLAGARGLGVEREGARWEGVVGHHLRPICTVHRGSPDSASCLMASCSMYASAAAMR